jgi:hypothetical protein
VVTTKRILVATASVVVVVVAAVLVLVLRGGSSPTVPVNSISARTLLSRSAAMFADPLQAKIAVLIDRSRVDPSRVGFDPNFKPYDSIGVPEVERHDIGRITSLVYTANLVCLTYACLPPGPSTRVQFQPAEIFYWRRSGERRTLKVSWFPLTLASRTSLADLNNADPFQQPAWRATTDPLAVSYSMSPALLRALLLAGSGVLFLAALIGVVGFVRTVLRRVRVPVATALERALALVEHESARDDQPAKRKALELLSRELRRSGEPQLALAARELAWAEPTPVSASTQPLTIDVRHVIAERSNGHAR